VNKLQLPEIVVGRTEDANYRESVIVLICGEERFDKRLHEQVTKKITDIFPYDYLVFNPKDTEEYLQRHPAEIQMWKYFDTVDALPEGYRWVIRFRNDIDWDEHFLPTLKIFKSAYTNGLTVGIQSFNYNRVIHNELNKTMMGDLIIFHSRNVLKNPRKNPIFTDEELFKKKLVWTGQDFCPHRAWFEMFDGRQNPKCHFNASDLRLYRQPEILKIWPKGLTPPDFGDEQ
jgi:hypothetical protein